MEVIQFEEVILPRSIAQNQDLGGSLKAMKELEYIEGDILICTYPKCGSHWTESLIRCLLRKQPDESILSRSCLLDLCSPDYFKSLSTPRIFFTHLHPNRVPTSHVRNGGKMVLILRNPKDIIVSLYYHLKRSVVVNNQQTWDEIFESYISGEIPFGDVFTYLEKWQDALRAKEFDIDYFYYEDLKENPVNTLKRLAAHIGVTKTDKELADIVQECSMKSLKDKVDPEKVPKALKDDKDEFVIYRKGEIGDWKRHFTVAQNEEFERVMQERMRNIMFKFRFE